MSGLSNQYVEDLMLQLSIQPEKFKGVKPCDIFLKEIQDNHHKLEKGNCFIINMSTSEHQGSHFVSIFYLPLIMPSILILLVYRHLIPT